MNPTASIWQRPLTRKDASTAAWAALLASIALFLLLAYVYALAAPSRYQFLNAGDGLLYRADRWTGQLLYVNHGKARKVDLPE